MLLLDSRLVGLLSVHSLLGSRMLDPAAPSKSLGAAVCPAGGISWRTMLALGSCRGWSQSCPPIWVGQSEGFTCSSQVVKSIVLDQQRRVVPAQVAGSLPLLGVVGKQSVEFDRLTRRAWQRRREGKLAKLMGSRSLRAERLCS